MTIILYGALAVSVAACLYVIFFVAEPLRRDRDKWRELAHGGGDLLSRQQEMEKEAHLARKAYDARIHRKINASDLESARGRPPQRS